MRASEKAAVSSADGVQRFAASVLATVCCARAAGMSARLKTISPPVKTFHMMFPLKRQSCMRNELVLQPGSGRLAVKRDADASHPDSDSTAPNAYGNVW